LEQKIKIKMGDEQLSDFIKNKKAAKQEMCSSLSLDCKLPLIGLVIDNELTEDDCLVIEQLLEGSTALDVEIVVLADTNLDSFSFAHVHHVPYSEKNRERLMKAADMMVALPHNDIEEWLFNGVVPITNLRDGLLNYSPTKETGNSFVYEGASGKSRGEADHWKIFAAIVRALETYKFPYDWKHIIGSGVRSVEG
jgi:hypothetical protein